jgi:tripartite-type tricarboxylate transporter receptor subunit TctC
MTVIMRHFLHIVAALFALSVLATPAGAETAAEFYKDKVVRLVVGYGPGGGYDAYARLLAPHLEARLGATVVVENRPGGGGMVAISQLAASEGDGLTLVLANLEAAALGQLLDSPGIRFDVSELPVVARVAAEPKVILLSAQSPFRTVADLRAADRAIKWSSGGKTDGIADSVALFSEALGLRSEIIIGYKGAKESALAAIRGETDGMAASSGSARKLAKNGDLVALAVLDRQREPLMPDVPTIFELVDLSDDQAWWVDYRASLTSLGRTLVTAPGTPADRLAYLRAAADAVLSDPAVAAEAEGKGRPLGYLAHGGVEELIARSVKATDASDIERLRDVILHKYY